MQCIPPESEVRPIMDYQILDNDSPPVQVVFMFGEIDCREGLLGAVEKGRYDSLEDVGMDASAGVCT